MVLAILVLQLMHYRHVQELQLTKSKLRLFPRQQQVQQLPGQCVKGQGH
jgi:hypothetical protein